MIVLKNLSSSFEKKHHIKQNNVSNQFPTKQSLRQELSPDAFFGATEGQWMWKEGEGRQEMIKKALQSDALIRGHCFKVGLMERRRKERKFIYPVPTHLFLPLVKGHTMGTEHPTLLDGTIWPLWHIPYWGMAFHQSWDMGEPRDVGVCPNGVRLRNSRFWPSENESRDWVEWAAGSQETKQREAEEVSEMCPIWTYLAKLDPYYLVYQ